MTTNRWSRHHRYYGWTRRSFTLDFGSEIWIDPKQRPELEDFQKLAKSRGKGTDAESLGYYMSRSLLGNVLLAAGGVEAEFIRLNDAMEAAREWTHQARKNVPLTSEDKRDPNFQEHSGAPSLLEGHYAFWNMLTWTRAVTERIERTYKPGDRRKVGLLPALAPGPRRDLVVRAFSDFRSRIGDTRDLANYVLHAGAIPGRGSPSAVVEPDGTLRVPHPDPTEGRVSTWDELEYSLDRDQVSVGGELMGSVDALVDSILDAFEQHLPARFR